MNMRQGADVAPAKKLDLASFYWSHDNLSKVLILCITITGTYQWPQRFPGYLVQKWPAGWWKWGERRRWRCAGASRRSCWGKPSAGSLSSPKQENFHSLLSRGHGKISGELYLTLRERARWARWVWRQSAQPHARTESACRMGQYGCRCEAALPPLYLMTRKDN